MLRPLLALASVYGLAVAGAACRRRETPRDVVADAAVVSVVPSTPSASAIADSASPPPQIPLGSLLEEYRADAARAQTSNVGRRLRILATAEKRPPGGSTLILSGSSRPPPASDAGPHVYPVVEASFGAEQAAAVAEVAPGMVLYVECTVEGLATTLGLGACRFVSEAGAPLAHATPAWTACAALETDGVARRGSCRYTGGWGATGVRFDIVGSKRARQGVILWVPAARNYPRFAEDMSKEKEVVVVRSDARHLLLTIAADETGAIEAARKTFAAL